MAPPKSDPTENTLAQADVLKPTATIHVANPFSLLERKTFNTLIHHSQKHGFHPGPQVLALKELCQWIGYNSRNRKLIKDVLEKLVGTTIEWNIFEQDKVVEWGICTFLASARIVRGAWIQYRINPEIVEWVNHPTLFAKFHLLLQTRFRNKHSLVLYEYFIDALSRQKVKTLALDPVPMEDIRRFLGIEAGQYEQFKIFNRDVLKPAVEEINRHTDIGVTAKSVRRARRVVAVGFVLQRKEVLQIVPNLPVSKAEELAFPTSEKPRNHTDSLSVEGNSVVALLMDEGVEPGVATDLVQRYGLERVQGNLEYMRQEIAAGKKIRNRAAYLVRAVEKDYRPKKSPRELREEKGARKRHAKKEARRQQEQVRCEWEAFRAKRVREVFTELPAREQEDRRQAFLEKLKGLAWEMYRKDGWESRVVQTAFFTDDRQQALLSRPEEVSFEAFCQWREEQGVEESAAQ